MALPRLLFALLGAVGLNAGLIVWSVVKHQEIAEVSSDGIQADSQPANETAKKAEPNPGTLESGAFADLPPSLPEDLGPELTVDLPENLPGDLPEIPSLDIVKNDPGFQEFLNVAVEQYPELEHLRGESDLPAKVTAEYFSRLQDRLKSVELLLAAANKMAAEGEHFAETSDDRSSAKFLQNITQLRELAASLLLEELY